MSDNLKRIPLDDEFVGEIAGGRVRVVSNPIDGKYCWGESNPNVKYAFKKTTDVLTAVNNYGNPNDEAGLIHQLLEAGLIWPI